MNKYPAWLYVLVLVVVLAGTLFALPNVFGSGPAIQLADPDGKPLTEERLAEFVRVVGNAGIEPEAAYLNDGRAVLRFAGHNDQLAASDRLRENFETEFSVAPTLASRMPAWVRKLGLNPMSLGLDLRGGVHVLLEVDMATAVSKRLELYQEDFDDRLREADIRHRVELDDGGLTVRVTTPDDLEATREMIRRADPDVIVTDGADGRSLRVRMTEAQIRERQNLAIEQNVTTLRNRVNELGVSEPIVQRQGEDRIVVQLPGVQDPSELDRMLTATATLEFRLVDTARAMRPGSRRYAGRGGEPGQMLKRRVVASGDQIVDASAGFSQGQPAVNIKLDAAGGESMLETTQNNLNKPMSTVFIETAPQVGAAQRRRGSTRSRPRKSSTPRPSAAYSRTISRSPA